MRIMSMCEGKAEKKERKFKVGDTVFFIKPLPVFGNVRYDIPSIQKCVVKEIRLSKKGILLIAEAEGEVFRGLSQFFWDDRVEAADVVRYINKNKNVYVPNADWVSEYLRLIAYIR